VSPPLFWNRRRPPLPSSGGSHEPSTNLQTQTYVPGCRGAIEVELLSCPDSRPPTPDSRLPRWAFARGPRVAFACRVSTVGSVGFVRGRPPHAPWREDSVSPCVPSIAEGRGILDPSIHQIPRERTQMQPLSSQPTMNLDAIFRDRIFRDRNASRKDVARQPRVELQWQGAEGNE